MNISKGRLTHNPLHKQINPPSSAGVKPICFSDSLVLIRAYHCDFYLYIYILKDFANVHSFFDVDVSVNDIHEEKPPEQFIHKNLLQ